GLIRLVGPNRCSGRVEIYNNGSWGTVCNVSKNLKDARVFCRQLGCGTALGLLHFGEGAGQIWLDDVACTGNERYFSECMRNGSVRQDCAHSEDLGVICSGLIKPTITINPQSDITLGQNVSITCSIPDGQLGGTFILNRTSDAFSLTVKSYSNSVILPKPSITIDTAGAITLGQLVAITCSISTQLLDGLFTLQKYYPNGNQNIKTQSSSTNSSTFRFLEVNSDHVGNYQCYYQKTVISRSLTSPNGEQSAAFSVFFPVFIFCIR
ncbi:hypothetical protein AMECASPLE_025889, partial [Ameca splendens]